MIEKIGSSGYEALSTPDSVVLKILDNLTLSGAKKSLTYYEIGVGIGVTTLEVAKRLNNSGTIILFSLEREVSELASDLAKLGFTNIDSSWGSPSRTYSGYHFQLAQGFVAGLLKPFDLAYIDGGHVFHLDAPAACVLKELCKPGGYMLFDDWYWSIAKSPSLNPSVKPDILLKYDDEQIKVCHVQLVCKVVMDTDSRFEFLGVEQGTAVYRRYV
ncbi:class I SAM-dependent methyltransferase [Arthrospira platensis NCB002]|jgi:predicted O-methyltransferase YrrM|uniref:Class I SAM-dependent methyltransferase n=1 Tax=Limnospira platensis NIES-46 TaxID=1236695 RepID=A0A5M3TEQ9_LIMPL|nr:class I SAM-dependent methyltransferase [Arthrospira platensis]MDF2211157.1 class I SAM-dependent methyltransferase [Arthrospira platensis NCB002]BAI88797.1 hypothetical protein NIES39_B00400 [Arthrospira platensis NIES-39]BDT11202.1 hypothetical protein N39L_09250 [Arthrospira platensis NIES-39]GCE96580.1 hypothetical protein NIES46_46520 [Arthrospira platensis NIES-46]